MARKSPDDPSSWYGTRTVSWSSTPCGYCASPTTLGDTVLPEGQHNCIHELPWFDKLWLCGCECNAKWKPVAVIVEKDGTISPTPEGLKIANAPDRSSRSKKRARAEESTESTEDDDAGDVSDDDVTVVVHSQVDDSDGSDEPEDTEDAATEAQSSLTEA